MLRDGLYDSRKVMVLPLSVFHPRSEIPELTVVPVIREPHLWSNKQYFAIMYNNAAVVYDVFMDDRPA